MSATFASISANGIRLVVLDHNDTLLSVNSLKHCLQTIDNVICKFQKHSVVCSQKRLTFASVQKNCFNRFVWF